MTKDMTKGPIFSTLVFFTIPLILGNLLQLTYNAIDSMIVGQYVGKNALAAVGTSNPLMTLVLLFTNGICLGAGVLVSYHFGGKKEDMLKRQVSTGMIAGVIFSICIAVLFAVFARPIFRLLQVDETILDQSVLYLRIILCGLVFSFAYNYLASVLRAMGDSRSPLIFLGLSAILNIIGDLFLVVVLHLGIVGVALSTVICEILSASLCWIYATKKIPILRLGRGWLVFDRKLLKTTLSYGIVSALQQSSVQIGKLMTQGMVNSIGINTAAAFNATSRYDDFATVPEQNIGHAMSSVMAQNSGAHKKDRVETAFRYGMYLEIGYGIAIGLVVYLFSNPLMHFFTHDAEVIAEGEKYLKLISLMYTLPAITNGIQGYFRGVGDLKITLWCNLINIGVRVVACAVLLYGFGMGFEALPWSMFIGWAAMILFEVPYIIRYRKHHHTQFEKELQEDEKLE